MRRLLIRPGAIGDFLLSLPALEFLRGDYTEVWCAEQNVALARFVDRARSIVSAGLDRVEIFGDAGVLEVLSGFDEIHSWYGTARKEFRDAVRHLPFRFYDALPPSAGVHATEFYCRQVGAPVTIPHLLVQRLAGDFFVLHPFASAPSKRWPLAHFERLAKLLGNVQWSAGPDEELPNAVRFDNLFELAQWIATAKAFIGNDSGITHLAAATGVPTVAIFGPTDPSIWAPRGPAVRVLKSVNLQTLSPEVVFENVKSLV